ncbi:XRE family transcriptional regulator [bacterium D16-54]|nr:XRE family transcriptional regulator [bacterium D16-54]RKJ09806.1 XRE family transcriptional regulator [bacterium D16-56]
MKSSDMIKELCEKENISVSELARRIGQSPQNFGKKLKRDTVTFDEMVMIADALEVAYEQAFVLKDGEKIQIGNMEM